MIISDLKSWKNEKATYHLALQRAVDWLETQDLTQLAEGRYEILGTDMFALIQSPQTVVRSERKSEHHEKYIDIQYLISGDEELQYVGRRSDHLVVIEDKLQEKDYALVSDVPNESEICLKPGMFAVYFPSDLHRPSCSRTGGTTIKKAVIKINKALLSER